MGWKRFWQNFTMLSSMDHTLFRRSLLVFNHCFMSLLFLVNLTCWYKFNSARYLFLIFPINPKSILVEIYWTIFCCHFVSRISWVIWKNIWPGVGYFRFWQIIFLSKRSPVPHFRSKASCRFHPVWFIHHRFIRICPFDTVLLCNSYLSVRKS